MLEQDLDTFLSNKRRVLQDSGFEVSDIVLHSDLKGFQRYGVKTSLKKGKYALLFDCGLGKTFVYLEWSKHLVAYTNRPVIILAPLAVVGQTIQEGEKWGIVVNEWQDGMNTLQGVPAGVYITNYEQLENLLPIISDFVGVVLDESSILKNFSGATRNLIIDAFADTEYKLACTATPSPNDPMELGNHSEFLDVMPYAEMLAMYFVHDGGDTSKWRLKKHCRKLFWRWVNSWAKMATMPSDLGFDNTGYVLPALNIIERQIQTPDRANGTLFNDVAISATNFNQELRLTKIERLSEVADIVNGSVESFIIWIKHNEEGEDLKKLIPGAIEVKGSDSQEYKKAKLLGFGNNEFRVLITKVKIAGFGMNYQNSHNMIFASPDFSFEGIYQALRRELRFGQMFEVNAWIITTDTMANVIRAFYEKKTQHEEMHMEMQQAMNNELNHADKPEKEYREVRTQSTILQHGNSLRLIRDIESDSIGLSMWSPPFPELYTYSDDEEDLGNCKNYVEFMEMFNFLPPELFRIMWAGRNVVIHCMDTPIQKGKEGYIGLRDFSGMIIQAMQAVGFIYHSRVTIWKDPVVEMQRTKALGLLHKQIKKDAAMSRVGIPDYLLVFRKPGEHLHPVIHQDTDPSKPNYLPVDLWQKYASPVWYDIDYGNTLNGRAGRDERDEKHICPLQLDATERVTHLWTNEGDICHTAFGGIGSEAFKWVLMNRRAILQELKGSYFDVAVKNVMAAEKGKMQAQLIFE